MRPNGYQIALEQATNEKIEIITRIEKLNRRKQSIEKLRELLEDLIPQPRAFGNPAAHPAPVPAVSEPQNFQDQAMPEMQPAANTTALCIKANGRPIAHEQVARLAYHFWTDSGCVHGHHEDNWFRAEKELRQAS